MARPRRDSSSNASSSRSSSGSLTPGPWPSRSCACARFAGRRAARRSFPGGRRRGHRGRRSFRTVAQFVDRHAQVVQLPLHLVEREQHSIQSVVRRGLLSAGRARLAPARGIRLPREERPAHGVAQMDEELVVLHHRIEVRPWRSSATRADPRPSARRAWWSPSWPCRQSSRCAPNGRYLTRANRRRAGSPRDCRTSRGPCYLAVAARNFSVKSFWCFRSFDAKAKLASTTSLTVGSSAANAGAARRAPAAREPPRREVGHRLQEGLLALGQGGQKLVTGAGRELDVIRHRSVLSDGAC